MALFGALAGRARRVSDARVRRQVAPSPSPCVARAGPFRRCVAGLAAVWGQARAAVAVVNILDGCALPGLGAVAHGVAARAWLPCGSARPAPRNTPYGLAERCVLQAHTAYAVLRYASLSAFFLSFRRAITVRSPVVVWPIFTHTSVPMGRNTSTLEPSFMNPRCSSM